MLQEIAVGVVKLHYAHWALSQIDMGRWSGGFPFERTHIGNMHVQYKDNIVMDQHISTTQLDVSSSNIDQILHTIISHLSLDLKLFSRGRQNWLFSNFVRGAWIWKTATCAR